MSDWWYVIAVVVIAVVAFLALRSSRGGISRTRGGRSSGARTDPDFRQDREDDRLAGMSEEDRAWEDASLLRDQDARARTDLPSRGN